MDLARISITTLVDQYLDAVTSADRTDLIQAELERFAQGCVSSGRFNNVSEVVRSALRLLQETEEHRASFITSLEQAVDEGRREGFSSAEDVEHEVRAAIAAVRTRKR